MENYLITFRSVTHAQRGQRLLEKAGFRASLGRTPRWMEEKGCGYSLRLSGSDITLAEGLLRQNGVPVRKFYTQKPDGAMEELVL